MQTRSCHGLILTRLRFGDQSVDQSGAQSIKMEDLQWSSTSRLFLIIVFLKDIGIV